MSPVLPAVVSPASLSGASSLLAMPSGSFNIADFNGNHTQLPPLTGPDRVGVHHFTIEHDLGFGFNPPAECINANTSIPQLRERYGDDGISFFNETCNGLHHIPVSVFYPTCVSPEDPQLKNAPVFTQSLLETITAQILGDANSMRNMESQALLNASICPDKYTMVMLSPPIGGQRQAYTQLASDIASYHHVVVTVDHAFQSGAIETESGNILFNLAGNLLKPRAANHGRVVDLTAVALHFNDSANLSPLLSTPGTEIDLSNSFVFGHGQGGIVAKMMVADSLLSSGGTLDDLIRMPAPYNESNVLYRPRHKPSSVLQPQPQPTSEPKAGAGDGADHLSEGLLERLKNMAQGLKKTILDSLSSLICRILGTCGTVIQKRGTIIPYYEPADWTHDENEYCDDLCFLECKLECKPRVPHGLFPDDLGQSAGKTLPDDGDWSGEWQEYRDNIGDYKGFPGRNPYREHEHSCYDDDYCNNKCCTKGSHFEYAHKQHKHEDQEYDGDRQYEGQVPYQFQDEKDAPLLQLYGLVTSPDLNAEVLSEEDSFSPDIEDNSEDDERNERDEDTEDNEDTKDDEDDEDNEDTERSW